MTANTTLAALKTFSLALISGRHLRTSTLIFACLLISACSTLNPDGTDSAQTKGGASQALDLANAAAVDEAASEAELAAASFEADTLYDLLLAEMASKENRLDLTLGNYQKQAKRTQDPGIITRYMRIARYMKAHQATLDAAEMFLKLGAPVDEAVRSEALQTATIEHIRLQQFDQAIQYMDELLTASADVNFDFFMRHVRQANPSVYSELITSLTPLLDKHPDNPKLWLTYGLLLDLNKDFKPALAAVKKAQALDADYIAASIAAGKIHHSLGDKAAALKTFKKAAKRHPDNLQLRTVYLKVLLDHARWGDAKEQLQALLVLSENNVPLKLRLALMAGEYKLDSEAEAILRDLITKKQNNEEARLYLARIYIRNENYTAAADTLKQVMPGTFYSNARMQLAAVYAEMKQYDAARQVLIAARTQEPASAARFYASESNLLVQQTRKDEAWALLNVALTEVPDNIELLYSRAMLAEQLDRLDILEQDLRNIIRQEPDSALALNALGYTLTDRTDRHQEALLLIENAYKIKPDDAAILDSMGWVNYRLGQYQKSLYFLAKAHELNDDAEIAAHLAEVLWLNGDKQQALEIIRKTEDKYPNTEYINELRSRLKIVF